MAARDYFESIQAEAQDLRRSSDTLERLRARANGGTQNLEFTGSKTVSDPTAALDALIDFEGRLEHRIDELNKEVAQACVYLYGKSNTGGIAKLKGSYYADAVCLVYLQAESMSEAADIMCCSKQWISALCSATFREIDRVGFAALANS